MDKNFLKDLNIDHKNMTDHKRNTSLRNPSTDAAVAHKNLSKLMNNQAVFDSLSSGFDLPASN